jgi:hypothetical protein
MKENEMARACSTLDEAKEGTYNNLEGKAHGNRPRRK